MSNTLERAFKSLRNNGGLKLLALALAVICWYLLRDATSFEQVVRDVPVRVLTAQGWAVLDQSVDRVDVLFRGSQQDVRYLNSDQVVVEIDLKDKSVAGSRTVRIDPERIRAPTGARAIVVDPPQLTFSIDVESDKVVPVKPDLLGKPSDDFDVEKVICTPATVTLHGPRRRLEQVEFIRTEPIELEGRIRSFRLDRGLSKPGESWSARMVPDRVQVAVNIVELSARKDFADVPVSALMPAGASGVVTMKPPRVRITLQGRTQFMDSLQKAQAFVDCAGMKAGQTLDLPVRAPVASGVDVVSIDPPMVRVTMEAP